MTDEEQDKSQRAGKRGSKARKAQELDERRSRVESVSIDPSPCLTPSPGQSTGGLAGTQIDCRAEDALSLDGRGRRARLGAPFANKSPALSATL